MLFDTHNGMRTSHAKYLMVLKLLHLTVYLIITLIHSTFFLSILKRKFLKINFFVSSSIDYVAHFKGIKHSNLFIAFHFMRLKMKQQTNLNCWRVPQQNVSLLSLWRSHADNNEMCNLCERIDRWKFSIHFHVQRFSSN